MKNLYRNIALISAVFALTLSIMLVTNYFQVRRATPLQSGVAETLKALNDVNADNPELQEQIRQLDLLSRKAYFVQESHLKTGIYILLGMLAVLLVSLRLYYQGAKDLPDKDLDEADDWLVKSRSRTYVAAGTAALVLGALVFAFLSSPYYKNLKEKPREEVAQLVEPAMDAEAAEPATETAPETDPATEAVPAEIAPEPVPVSEPAPESEPEGEPLPKVTHNGFRGNNSIGQSRAAGIPTSWNLASGRNIAWKVPVPRGGFNSPAVSGRNVFLSGADAEARELYCYDLFTGELRWTLQASGIPGSPSVMPQVNADTGLAASSVATNGQQVCAIFATGDIICADMDGKRLWAKNLGVPDNHYGFASSLLIYGSEVIVQYDNDSDGKLIALNLSDGAVRWSKARTETATWSSPIIAYADRKPLLVVMGNPNLCAYNPDNGELVWQVKCMSGEVGASPCTSSGVVYAASEYAKLVAVNGSDGSVLWEVSDFLPEVSSPVATADYVYVATSYGMLICYDAHSGEVLAEQDLGTQFYSSPMLVEGRIYIFGTEGNMYIFRNDGKLSQVRTIETGERTFATPAFTDGRIVVRTEGNLYCVKAE